MDKTLYWQIHDKCNFRCVYCASNGKGIPSAFVKPLSPEQWKEHWDRFNDKFGPARIYIAGGEPFFYPDFLDILEVVSRRNTVRLATNFCWDPAPFLKKIDPARVALHLSLHPTQIKDENVFLEKAAALAGAGFDLRVRIVAFPGMIGDLSGYKRLCEAHGLGFTALAFRGNLNGKCYPESYTREEAALIRSFIVPAESAAAQLSTLRPRGLECCAGFSQARIQPDGSITRCLNGPRISSFFDPDPRFLVSPEKCGLKVCNCPFERVMGAERNVKVFPGNKER